jgi:hypothetical protein
MKRKLAVIPFLSWDALLLEFGEIDKMSTDGRDFIEKIFKKYQKWPRLEFKSVTGETQTYDLPYGEPGLADVKYVQITGIK